MKKVFSITLVISLLVTVLAVPVLGEEKLNPDFAAVLSVMVPGLGQIYAKETTRGLIFFGSEMVIFAVGTGLIQAALKDPMMEAFEERGVEVVGKDGKTYTVFAVPSREEMEKRVEQFFENMDGGQVALLGAGGLLILGGIGFHVFGAIDAYNLANQ